MTETHDWQNAGSDPEAFIRSEGAGPPFAEHAFSVTANPVATLPADDEALQLSLTRQLAAGVSAALAPESGAAAATLPGVEPEVAAIWPEASGGSPDDDLEDGIASVFAALYAAGDRDTDRSDAAAGAGDDSAALAGDDTDDAVTFRLLGELDRLWHQRAA